MPFEDTHHVSKKRGYTFLLVANDDIAEPKNVRLALWQVVSLIVGLVVVMVAGVLMSLMYTPVGTWITIPNPAVEIRYTQELVALNQKMTLLMEQLVELRSYNIKLRNALGESVAATDSGGAVVRKAVRRDGDQVAEPVWRMGQQSSPFVAQSTYPLTAQTAGESNQRVAFPVILPTEGYVTRGYSPEQRHFGLDIAGKIGRPVNAAADGYVVFSGWTNDDGYVVILSHPSGFLTFYKHNRALLKGANVFVKRGEPIAFLGDSGRTSSGPHLHFEIWKDGTPVNPVSYVLNFNL